MPDVTKQPTLSVVTANYNHGRFLRDMMRAVLEQSWSPIEIIVIDDCSTDDSVAILAEFARQDARISVHRNEVNRGVIYTANRGLALAKGDYIYFGAADDKVLPGLFEKSMRLLAQYPQAGVCSSLSTYIDEEGRQTGVMPKLLHVREATYFPPERCAKALVAQGHWIQGNTAFYARQALIDAGGFRDGLYSYVDGFVQDVLALQRGACYIPEYLATWRRLSDGYATVTSEDPGRMMEVLVNVKALMRGEFADVFPVEVAEHWERNWRFAAVTNAMGKYRREQDARIHELLRDAAGVNGWTERLVRAIVRGAAAAEGTAVKAAAFLSLKSFGHVFRKRLRLLMAGKARPVEEK